MLDLACSGRDGSNIQETAAAPQRTPESESSSLYSIILQIPSWVNAILEYWHPLGTECRSNDLQTVQQCLDKIQALTFGQLCLQAARSRESILLHVDMHTDSQ